MSSFFSVSWDFCTRTQFETRAQWTAGHWWVVIVPDRAAEVCLRVTVWVCVKTPVALGQGGQATGRQGETPRETYHHLTTDTLSCLLNFSQRRCLNLNFFRLDYLQSLDCSTVLYFILIRQLIILYSNQSDKFNDYLSLCSRTVNAVTKDEEVW